MRNHLKGFFSIGQIHSRLAKFGWIKCALSFKRKNANFATRKRTVVYFIPLFWVGFNYWFTKSHKMKNFEPFSLWSSALFNNKELRYFKCSIPALWLCVCVFSASDVCRTMLETTSTWEEKSAFEGVHFIFRLHSVNFFLFREAISWRWKILSRYRSQNTSVKVFVCKCARAPVCVCLCVLQSQL